MAAIEVEPLFMIPYLSGTKLIKHLMRICVIQATKLLFICSILELLPYKVSSVFFLSLTFQ